MNCFPCLWHYAAMFFISSPPNPLLAFLSSWTNLGTVFESVIVILSAIYFLLKVHVHWICEIKPFSYLILYLRRFFIGIFSGCCDLLSLLNCPGKVHGFYILPAWFMPIDKWKQGLFLSSMQIAMPAHITYNFQHPVLLHFFAHEFLKVTWSFLRGILLAAWAFI